MAQKLVSMVKHKKWVALLGYSGQGYYGMQRQTCDNKEIEDLPTIESELLKSFHKCGLINDNEFGNPSIMRFQRAARTDKGVSAVKQIISLNVANDVHEFMPKVNELLPSHIRIFSAKRATKFFDSKNFCDARTYSYLLPSFALCPVDKVTEENYTVTNEAIEEFNEILKMFTGTHNFHNFTSGKKPTDPSAKRYIMSFECSQPFMMGNAEKKLQFLTARVKGQSFMLHQIRKMIGLSIAVMRGFADRSTITRSFGEERLDIPIAPGLGLLLEEVHYERYNKKFGGDGHHQALLWEEVNGQVDSFKNEHIYPKIVDTEISEMSMFNWLATLPIHTFDVRLNPFNDPLIKPLVRAHYNATTCPDSDTDAQKSESNLPVPEPQTQDKDTEDENEYESKHKKLKVDI